MENIRIITDSASDFPQPYPANLTVIPLTIRFGDEEFKDGVDISCKEFFERLAAAPELPKTSLIPPSDFEAAFDEAEAAGETVIAVLLSSKLSGTCQSARIAADGRDSVFVVDSMNATIGEQILVQYALRLVEQGMGADAIAAELERVKSKIRLLGLPDTLEYLRKGGRISKTVAFVGGVLSVKPVLALVDGEIILLGKARGSRNGNNYLIKEVEKTGIDFSMPYCLGYTGLSDALLQQYIRDSRQLWEGQTDSLPISTVGATIGTHVGPDAIVVAYFGKMVSIQ